MSNPPQLTIDGAEMELFDDDDPLSNSSVKAKLAWDNRDNEYVLVWWQSPFYIATENGGYSMTRRYGSWTASTNASSRSTETGTMTSLSESS